MNAKRRRPHTDEAQTSTRKEPTMKNNEQTQYTSKSGEWLEPLRWRYSEVGTANEYGEAYGCLDLVPDSDVYYYTTDEAEWIVYRTINDPDVWGCDVYEDGGTAVSGATGATHADALTAAVIEYVTMDVMHKREEENVEDAANLAAYRAFASLNDGEIPDNDPADIAVLDNIMGKVNAIIAKRGPHYGYITEESDPAAVTIAAQIERTTRAQNAARMLNNLNEAARAAEAAGLTATAENIRSAARTAAAPLKAEGYQVEYLEFIDLYTVKS